MCLELATHSVTLHDSKKIASIALQVSITSEEFTLPIQKYTFSERNFHEEFKHATKNWVGHCVERGQNPTLFTKAPFLSTQSSTPPFYVVISLICENIQNICNDVCYDIAYCIYGAKRAIITDIFYMLYQVSMLQIMILNQILW